MTLHDSVQVRATGLPGEVLTPGQDGYDEAATTLFPATRPRWQRPSGTPPGRA